MSQGRHKKEKVKVGRVDEISEGVLRIVAEIMKAMAHPVRLKILCALRDGEKSVRDLGMEVNKSQAVVSQQLRILRLHGLVVSHRRDGFAYYSLASNWMGCIRNVIESICRCIEK